MNVRRQTIRQVALLQQQWLAQKQSVKYHENRINCIVSAHPIILFSTLSAVLLVGWKFIKIKQPLYFANQLVNLASLLG